jgi:hypothetical protein
MKARSEEQVWKILKRHEVRIRRLERGLDLREAEYVDEVGNVEAPSADIVPVAEAATVESLPAPVEVEPAAPSEPVVPAAAAPVPIVPAEEPREPIAATVTVPAAAPVPHRVPVYQQAVTEERKPVVPADQDTVFGKLAERSAERKAWQRGEAPIPPPPVFTPAPVAQPFSTEEEIKAPAARFQREETPEAPATSLEERIGTTWLLRIGGVLIMLGAAWGAVRLESSMSPGIRVLAGFLLALGVGAAGWVVRARNEMVGRAGLGIALALGYFVSFASHYIDRMDVGMAWPWLAIGGMLLHAGVLVRLAERWRSEALAGFGLCLALVPALMSAGSSNSFALLAIMGLGLASGVLLLRNGWMRLTSIAVGLVYGSIGAVAFLQGAGSGGGGGINAASYLVALGVQHLIFVAAFLRWSRPWLARERAMDRLEEEAVPSGFVVGLLPWGRGFDMLNTLGLIAAVFFVGWMDAHTSASALWANMHWVLGSIGVVELLRLALRSGRDEQLGAFHSIAGALLFVTATVWALEGASESMALAIMALILTIAGHQSRHLRWLRALSIIPATMALSGAGRSILRSPTLELGTLVTPLLLLVSTLPFERWINRARADEDGAAARLLTGFAAQWRSMIAVGLGVAITLRYLDNTGEVLALIALTSALLVGMRAIGFRAWSGAALIASAALALTTFIGFNHSGAFGQANVIYFASAFGFLLIAALWSGLNEDETRGGQRAIAVLGMAGAGACFLILQGFALSRSLVHPGLQIIPPAMALLLLHPWLRSITQRIIGVPNNKHVEAVACTLLIGMVMLPLLANTLSLGAMPALVAAAVLATIATVGARAQEWRFGLVGGLLAALAVALFTPFDPSPASCMELVAAVLVAVAAFDVTVRRLRTEWGASLWPVPAIPATILFLLVANQFGGEWRSMLLLGLAALAGGVMWLVERIEASPSPWRGATCGTALASMAVATAIAVVLDAPMNMVPGLVLSALVGAAWLISARRAGTPEWLPLLLNVGSLVLASSTLLAHYGIAPWPLFTIASLGLVFHLVARAMGRSLEMVPGAALVQLAIFGSFINGLDQPTPTSALTGLMIVAMGLGLSRVRYFETAETNAGFRGLLVFTSVALALLSMSGGHLIPTNTVTAVWGVFAVVLLIAGFAGASRLWRRNAIAIFGLCLVRLIFVDLANTDTTARILAALGVGVLMVGSAYLYGWLSKTFLSKEEDS